MGQRSGAGSSTAFGIHSKKKQLDLIWAVHAILAGLFSVSEQPYRLSKSPKTHIKRSLASLIYQKEPYLLKQPYSPHQKNPTLADLSCISKEPFFTPKEPYTPYQKSSISHPRRPTPSQQPAIRGSLSLCICLCLSVSVSVSHSISVPVNQRGED